MTIVDQFKEAVLGRTESPQSEESSPHGATHQQMIDARLPLQYRDNCAGLLIPLNECRHKEWFLPWKCENERHTYEKCQYQEFKKRVAKLEQLKAENPGKRVN